MAQDWQVGDGDESGQPQQDAPSSEPSGAESSPTAPQETPVPSDEPPQRPSNDYVNKSAPPSDTETSLDQGQQNRSG